MAHYGEMPMYGGAYGGMNNGSMRPLGPGTVVYDYTQQQYGGPPQFGGGCVEYRHSYTHGQQYGGPPQAGMYAPMPQRPVGYGEAMCQQMGPTMAPVEKLACDAFVEVSPVVEPIFNRGPNNTFIMDLPEIRVRLSTSCTPPLPPTAGMQPCRPYEEFSIQLPEVSRVVFDPYTGTPPNALATASTSKRGAVLEFPQHVMMNAQVKSNSPYGSLVLEDLEVSNGYKRKTGESTLNYSLHVDGRLSVNKGGGNMGSNRLEVELTINFECSLKLGPSGPSMSPQGDYGSMMGPPPPAGPGPCGYMAPGGCMPPGGCWQGGGPGGHGMMPPPPTFHGPPSPGVAAWT